MGFRGLLLVVAMLVGREAFGQCVDGTCTAPPVRRTADASTAMGFARQLRTEGVLRHANNLKGPEVVYYSSSRPRGLFWRLRMKKRAVAAWRQSPGHNALLPQIRRIRVSGNYVVGR